LSPEGGRSLINLTPFESDADRKSGGVGGQRGWRGMIGVRLALHAAADAVQTRSRVYTAAPPPRTIMSPLCRGAKGPFPLPALRQRGAIDRRQCRIGVGPGVAFDPSPDAVQIKVEGGELDVGCTDFADPPDIKR
jgi:hypothetical protein